jgi:hypothetical protein
MKRVPSIMCDRATGSAKRPRAGWPRTDEIRRRAEIIRSQWPDRERRRRASLAEQVQLLLFLRRLPLLPV